MNNQGSRLVRAAARGDRIGISQALHMGADPNITNDKGESPLMLLCASDQEIRWFLYDDEDMIDDYDSEDENADEGRPPIVKSLDELFIRGANIYASNLYKQDAIFYAVSSEGTSGLRWLLQKGIFLLDNKDDFGNSPLDGRRLSSTTSVDLPAFCGNIAILLAYGAKWPLEDIQYCLDNNPDGTPCELKDFLGSFYFLSKKQPSDMIHNNSNMDFYNKELQDMCCTKVTSSKTLINILYLRRSDLYLDEHTEFVNYFMSNNQCFKKLFPQFGLFLNAVFDKSLLRYTMLKKSSLAFEAILGMKLENKMLENIFMFFSNYELKTLVIAIH